MARPVPQTSAAVRLYRAAAATERHEVRTRRAGLASAATPGFNYRRSFSRGISTPGEAAGPGRARQIPGHKAPAQVRGRTSPD